MMSNVSKNLLSPNKFKVVMRKYLALQELVQKVNLPGFSFSPAQLPTNTNNDVSFPGDKLIYDDLTLTFLLNDDLSGYIELHQWFTDITKRDNMRSEYYDDISVIILDNNQNPNIELVYNNCMPWVLAGNVLDFMMDESVPLTIDVTFKFNMLEIKQLK